MLQQEFYAKLELARQKHDELYHHGILGQKWGIRRFQEKDGSYTQAGRERYGYGPAREPKKDITDDEKVGGVATGLAVYGGYKLSGEVKKWKKTRELVDSYTFHRTMEDMAKGHEKYYKNVGDMSKAADSFNNARVMRQQKHNDQVQMAEFIEKQLKKKVPHDMYVFN